MTDYTLESTFDVKFTTRAFATGIPTALVSGAIAAYPDNSTTQLTAGLTLTASFDSVAGLNNIRVAATAANGYASGSTYYLVLTAGTVGGVSVVGEVVGMFTLGRGAAAVDLANGTDGLTALKTVLDAILVDTGTTLQAELDAIQAAVITNAAGTDIAADIVALKAVADAVLADTDDIGVAGAGLTALASAANLATVDTVVDGIKAKTDNLPTDPADQSLIIAATNAITTAIGNLNDLSAADILGATVTEGFSTAGADPTLAQILHEIRQGTLEFAISGTTLTVKKKDGATTAMTFTLDDATNPTSRTRAT